MAKVVHDVVQGRMRTKRRNRGLGMEDSDSEEEDEEARMLRRKSMNKKRRIEGDKLEDLGAFFLPLLFVSYSRWSRSIVFIY